jgi:primosomal protein N' (replication factor Y)
MPPKHWVQRVCLPMLNGLSVYPAVPMSMQRVANVERAQMLVESHSRKRLQQFLASWQDDLQQLRTQHKAVLRWAIDVDPLAI